MTTVSAAILHSDGTAEAQVIDPDEIGDILGGWLEVIAPSSDPHGDWNAFCDEEGKLKGLPLNAQATTLLTGMGWRRMGGDFLVGTVVLVGPPNGQGESTDLAPETLQHVLDFYQS